MSQVQVHVLVLFQFGRVQLKDGKAENRKKHDAFSWVDMDQLLVNAFVVFLIFNSKQKSRVALTIVYSV